MSGPTAARPLSRVPVPAGAAGVSAVLAALVSALDGTGPAIAPIPTVSPTVSNDYVAALLAATRPDSHEHPLEDDRVAVVMTTSGSTGNPRGVLLTAAALTSMNAAANGTGTPQWIAALPVTSMGGMNVLVRALASGRDPVVVPSLGGAGPFTPQAFADAVSRARGQSADVRVSLVPAQVARLLGDPAGIDALAACEQVLVGGAPTRPSLRQAAEDLGIFLTTTYGSTETSGGCVYNGTPLPGVHVTSDAATAEVPGRLAISGPCVALGYRGDPEATAAAFVDGSFITSDVGVIDPDGRVAVLGRVDDIVIINGVNVSPAAVERVVADLPDVVAAAVVSTGGAEPRLVAFVEVREAAPDLEAAVAESVRQALGRIAVPEVRRVPRLPHLPNGKVDRLTLQSRASEED